MPLETPWPRRTWWFPLHTYPIPGGDTRVRPPAGSGAAGGGCCHLFPAGSLQAASPEVSGSIRTGCWAGWLYIALLKLDEGSHTPAANLGYRGVLQPQLNPLPPASTQLQVSRSLIPWGDVEERFSFAGC